MIDITGKSYGSLAVISKHHQNSEKRWSWLCRCDCGNEIIAPKNTLDYGRDCTACRPHKNQTHGMKGSIEYNSWAGMKDRCLNKNCKDYHLYGGIGIKICDRWLNFDGFYEDMGDRPTREHSIDRMNTRGNYEKSNCRWATPREQARNRRTSKIWHIKGKIFDSAMKAANYFNVSDVTIHRWCKGGDRTIIKEDCFFEDRYK